MTSSGQDNIPAGYVRRAHGIHGDVVVRGTLQDADQRFIEGALLVTNEDDPRELEIEAVRPHQDGFIITFVGIDDRDAAEGMRGIQFVIDSSDRRELAADEWWPEDLVGCNVISVAGAVVGVVSSVIVGTAQDRIVIDTPEGSRGEVPFVAALVPEVDVAAARIVVDLPDGLFE